MLPKNFLKVVSVRELVFSMQADMPLEDRVKICQTVITRYEALLAAARDAKHTLENTTCCEPGWSKGSVLLLDEAITKAEGRCQAPAKNAHSNQQSETLRILRGLANAYVKLPYAQTAPGSWHSHAIAHLADAEGTK